MEIDKMPDEFDEKIPLLFFLIKLQTFRKSLIKKRSLLGKEKVWWEDKDWAFDNYSEWMKKYPDQWIAVVDKRVVAAGKDVQEIKKIAREKTSRKYIAVVYLEGGIRIL